MSKIKTAIRLLKEDRNVFISSVIENFFRWLPDIPYLKLLYRFKMGHKLNLNNPKTFTEKLQWLKLYNKNPIYTTMVDKCEVKEYVARLIGKEYIIPTFAVYDCPEEIDFDVLPDQFVLKCTHDSGGIVICKDKSRLDRKEVIKKLRKAQKSNFYRYNREWPYKNVRPRIIAEQYMTDGDGEIKDYKFFCFNGQSKFLYLSQGLDDHATAKMSFLNIDWTFAPFQRADYTGFEFLPLKPNNFEKMLEIVNKLSEGVPHVRVDLYNINGKIYFGELTFFTNSGMIPFNPPVYDYKIGDYIVLSK